MCCENHDGAHVHGCTVPRQVDGTEHRGGCFVFERGDHLRKALQVSGISSQAMADNMGVSRNTISNMINGRVPVRKQTLMFWALATGVSLDWLSQGEYPDSLLDSQSGDPCTRQYPEVGHEDEGYSCSTHNMPWGECDHQSGDPS